MTNALPTLRAQVLRRIIAVAVVGVSIMCAWFLVTLHVQVHRQTDGLLAHLLEAERHDMALTDDPHVHAWPLGLPGAHGRYADKAGLVLGPACELLASTPQWTPRHTTPPLCDNIGEWIVPHILDVEDGSGGLYRMAIGDARRPDGSPIRVAIGLHHDDIDQATWEAAATVAPLAAILLLTLTLLPGSLLMRIGRQVETLALVSDTMNPDDPVSLARGARLIESADPAANRETRTLSIALARLAHQTASVLEQHRRFIGEAAHDLRTPLTALIGDIDVTLRRPRTPAEYTAALERAHDNASHLHHLAEQLLGSASANSEPLDTMTLELADVVERLQQRLQPTLQAHHCTLDTRHAQGSIHASDLLVERILSNLIVNAIVHGAATHITLQTEPPRDHLLTLNVVDNGSGIPDDMKPRLFLPFSRSDHQNSTGLGLYLSQQLAIRMGGGLVYAGPNPSGHGTRMQLTLPAAATDAHTSPL